MNAGTSQLSSPPHDAAMQSNAIQGMHVRLCKANKLAPLSMQQMVIMAAHATLSSSIHQSAPQLHYLGIELHAAQLRYAARRRRQAVPSW